MDEKFTSDPYNVELHGLLSEAEYEQAINMVNDMMKPARAGIGGQLAFYGIGSIVFTAPCAYVHYKRVRKRKKLLHEARDRFNKANPQLMMRWNRRPESKLTIERRRTDRGNQNTVVKIPQVVPPQPPDLLTGRGFDMRPMSFGKKD